jgi:Pyruvate/2-oxoacid:ferredoxin oxidoreductase gamma subunit
VKSCLPVLVGQGILMCGKVLAHAAMEEGHEVVWIPSYGPEMRGEPPIAL